MFYFLSFFICISQKVISTFYNNLGGQAVVLFFVSVAFAMRKTLGKEALHKSVQSLIELSLRRSILMNQEMIDRIV